MNRARGWASPQRHRPVRRRPLVQLLSLICVAAALGLTGCGSTRSASISTSPPPSTPPEIATSTPTADPTDAAILNAYDQAMAAWVVAGADPTTDNDYPGLDEWYTGDELSHDVSLLVLIAQEGLVVGGTDTPHPVVTTVDGSTATVRDCSWNTQYAADKGTTTPASPQPYGWSTASAWENLTVTMLLQSGTWKISDEVSEATPCTPASASP